ncbi:MAG: zinc metalloprotease HtpX [Candidatus Yanofskybacteria bacterium RIFCSPHIGHO2_01_FULL_42_12]|uniref:Protease HtpX homolog n=1 Tax=Candidatus Yanofskybacteria bacterium RIFCSPLOWO2_01_FULL_42_49 TaxID=1802694 RepID=A0A1F8GCL5_9BACT|nr:MAG: zinc metalloprotease HtpX [Candidatus Yanofskybacteria bacterium RIFCSPHIGHO2_01_FULL_42_12]OGN23011.1 MAG: zinc metalloprotease HtpX [Candidatus Yanofskybacteria bacterium RIFCSPLOWO2_01_FULL_42_49]
MANLYQHKDSNIRKTWLLMTVFLVLIIFIGWLFGFIYNSPEILYFAVFLAVSMNFFAYWYSDKVALAMSGAKPASRETHLELFRIIENLSITAGLPMPRVYVMHDGQINAFATGRDPKHAAIAVTEGALAKLDKTELEGVLAHELSHIGNRDILISSVVVVLAGLIAILADWFLRAGLGGNLGGRDNDNKQGGAVILLVAIAVAVLAPLIATIIRLAVSRKREFLADASGALLTRYPEGLAGALEKIAQDQTPMHRAHSGTAHLFISNPFKGKQESGWFTRLFLTHPPTEERIRILRRMQF